MIKFSVTKKSTKSNARLGILKTPQGEIQTPAFVPVATQGVIKTLTSEEVIETNSQILIANTFHLHLKPGEKIVKENGGLHNFMNWQRPLMTDSGGFQVFSLGFGRDHGVGKILKEKIEATVVAGQQPTDIKITEDGVEFRSPLDGHNIFFDPATSIKIQQDIGADIIFAFDEATSPVANFSYTQQSLDRTHRWAKQSLIARTTDQALFGIVQGGKFDDLRQFSAKFISTLDFDGFGIGGEYGDDKNHMFKMLNDVNTILPSTKPRHLLGIGHLEDFIPAIQAGADTFDCIVPTHYARHGTAFITADNKQGWEKIDLTKSEFLNDQLPLDSKIDNELSQTYRRSYLAHLLRAKEITALKVLTYHNLTFFNKYVENIRDQITHGKL